MSNPTRENVISTVRQIARSFSALAHTRLELFSLEFAEEKSRLISAFALAMVAVLLGIGTLFAFTVLIAAIFWDDYRWQALTVLTLVYALLAILCTVLIRRTLANAPRAFDATLGEFEKDREAFASAAPAHGERQRTEHG